MKRICALAAVAFLLMGMQSAPLQTATSFFRIRYDKSVSGAEVNQFGSLLESAYAKFKKKFNVTPAGRVDVMYYSSAPLMKHETKIPLFDDGVFVSGKIYVSSGLSLQGPKMQGMISRVAARCILNQVKTCPLWLAECYGIYAGNELQRYGRPARPSMLSFADLAEDFSKAERADEYREAYAKLGVTAAFFIERYGEAKFENVFAQLKGGRFFEEALEASFGEKIAVIEKAWSKALAAPPK